MLNEWSDRPTSRWRAVLFGHRRTRWRATRREAEDDAVQKGWSHRDTPGGIAWHGPGVVIEEQKPPPRRWLGPVSPSR